MHVNGDKPMDVRQGLLSKVIKQSGFFHQWVEESLLFDQGTRCVELGNCPTVQNNYTIWIKDGVDPMCDSNVELLRVACISASVWTSTAACSKTISLYVMERAMKANETPTEVITQSARPKGIWNRMNCIEQCKGSDQQPHREGHLLCHDTKGRYASTKNRTRLTVASSKTKIFVGVRRARARDTSCFWPWDRLEPISQMY